MTNAERIVKILLEGAPRIRGEYWIIDGDVSFADGDVGEINHEGYAIDHARRVIMDHFGQDYHDEGIDDDELRDGVVAGLIEDGVPVDPQDWYPAAKRALQADPDAERMVATLACAIGHGDARECAMKYWGWKWCRGSNIGTWTFTADDRRSIVKGLNEIIGQEMADEGESWDELEITIGVGATGKRYAMTMAELESGRSVSRDPTWGGMGESEDGMLNYMLPEIDRITTSRKFNPEEGVSNGTFDTVDLCRRGLEKLAELNYSEWERFVANNQEYVEALDHITTSHASGDTDSVTAHDDSVAAHEAVDSFWELIVQELQKYCPAGYEFGSHPGSGSSYGCWVANYGND